MRHQLRLLIVAELGVLFSATAFAAFVGDSWHTWLFVWGFGLGVVGALHSAAMARWLSTVSSRPADYAATQFRRRLNTALMLNVGLGIGLVAGSADLLWLDVVFTALLVSVWVVTPLVAVAVLRKRRLDSRELEHSV